MRTSLDIRTLCHYPRQILVDQAYTFSRDPFGQGMVER